MKSGKQLQLSPKWALLIAVVAAFLVVAKLTNTNPPTNRATTSPGHEDEALRSRFYEAPLSRVITAAQTTLQSQRTYGRSWKITGYDSSTVDSQQIHVEVPVLVFTDDLTVSIKQGSDGHTRVDCVSASRLGSGDFGENKRHVAQFLDALDLLLMR
jgi:uncharacterized protein (DUF1499 family)